MKTPDHQAARPNVPFNSSSTSVFLLFLFFFFSFFSFLFFYFILLHPTLCPPPPAPPDPDDYVSLSLPVPCSLFSFPALSHPLSLSLSLALSLFLFFFFHSLRFGSRAVRCCGRTQKIYICWKTKATAVRSPPFRTDGRTDGQMEGLARMGRAPRLHRKKKELQQRARERERERETLRDRSMELFFLVPVYFSLGDYKPKLIRIERKLILSSARLKSVSCLSKREILFTLSFGRGVLVTFYRVASLCACRAIRRWRTCNSSGIITKKSRRMPGRNWNQRPTGRGRGLGRRPWWRIFETMCKREQRCTDQRHDQRMATTLRWTVNLEFANLSHLGDSFLLGWSAVFDETTISDFDNKFGNKSRCAFGNFHESKLRYYEN